MPTVMRRQKSRDEVDEDADATLAIITIYSYWFIACYHMLLRAAFYLN